MKELFDLMREDARFNRSAGALAVLFLLLYRMGRHCLVGRTSGNPAYWLPYAVIWPLYRVMQVLLGCSVPFSCRIGRRVVFVHSFYGVFISGAASIGDESVLMHQVTIGANYGGVGRVGSPSLGRGVFVGVGAKIIGPVVVGDAARIGANAVVVGDVDASAVLASPRAVRLR